ncbi:holliday junction resolvase [Rhodobacter phage RcDurkin]|nr:holliday junction resolvase [Rhodobacter phage RcDurkin]
MMAKERKPREANPLLARLGKQINDIETKAPAYRASRGLEKKLAIRVGGKVTPGSGNKTTKGDVRKTGIARLEHKATCHASFRVTREMIDKIEGAAVGCGEIPAIVVELLDAEGKPSLAIACIPLSALEELIANAS